MAKKKTTLIEDDGIDRIALAQSVALAEPEPPADYLPAPSDYSWNDFVLSKFASDELDPEGHPTTDGLRRVAEELLGPIISSTLQVVQCPDDSNGHRATCVTTIAIRFNHNLEDVRVFSGAADVYPGNTDPIFSRFSVATADTRSEGRALRKALKLRKVVTSEEVTKQPVAESGLTGFITPGQINSMDKTCRQLDINAVKFYNSGSDQYEDVEAVPYNKALKMLEYLSAYLQHPEKIPVSLQGYRKDWN